MLLYSRKQVRYRRDGYCWKKRKDGKTTREDHMKLKVQGIECIYGCYVHSAILPTFHRRCYWLLQVKQKIIKEILIINFLLIFLKNLFFSFKTKKKKIESRYCTCTLFKCTI